MRSWCKKKIARILFVYLGGSIYLTTLIFGQYFYQSNRKLFFIVPLMLFYISNIVLSCYMSKSPIFILYSFYKNGQDFSDMFFFADFELEILIHCESIQWMLRSCIYDLLRLCAVIRALAADVVEEGGGACNYKWNYYYSRNPNYTNSLYAVCTYALLYSFRSW